MHIKPILLVEDDRIDAIGVQRALNDLKVLNQLIIRKNGEEAMEYLKDDSSIKPAFILLDLIMPRMNGIEFLEMAKTDEDLKKYPVIVLTTSDGEWERLLAFDLGVAGYMVKPVDYKQFLEALRIIDLSWILSELPD